MSVQINLFPEQAQQSFNKIHISPGLPNYLKNEQNNQMEKQVQKQISFRKLFRFATKYDYFLMIIGIVSSCLMGATFPAFSYLMGRMMNGFNMQSSEGIVSESKQIFIQFIAVGAIAFVSGWTMFTSWSVTGQRQANKCKRAYHSSIVQQEIAFYDQNNQTELTSKFLNDTFSYQGAIGQKVSTLISTISTLISGFAFAFATGWLMTLVIMITVPIIGSCGLLYIKVISSRDKIKKQQYSTAAGYAQQALYSIRTVKQFNAEQFQLQKYSLCLEKQNRKTKKYLIYSAMASAGIFSVILISFSLGLWYGIKCIIGSQSCPFHVSLQNYSAGDVLAIFFSSLIGGENLSQVVPCLKKIAEGMESAGRIYKIIDRVPLVNYSESSSKIQNFQGIIKFQNVSFCYPKDKNKKILNNLSIEFNVNKIGLIGQSGCGKSTILQLIMRYYDPDSGKIFIDGHDLRGLDLKWWRSKVGYVGQQPVLFYGTIRDNLLIANSEAKLEELEACLRKAQAWNFVTKLQKGMDTFVGGGGNQLSGGQKQRIAIARALLKNPKILLLDEATSALDKINQRLIQKTLDNISSSLISITIAHRVDTLKNNDIILKLKNGTIESFGNFSSLFPNLNNNKDLPQSFQDIDCQEQAKSQEQQKNENQNTNLLNQSQNQQTQQFSIIKRVFSYGKEKVYLYFIGILCAIGNGIIFPLFSVFLSKIFVSMLIIDQDPSNQAEIHQTNMYALIFLILGLLAFFLHTAQSTCFSLIGELITKKLRTDVYYKMLRMSIKWFDDENNNPGALSNRLSTDCEIVNGVITSTTSVIVQNISTLLSGLVISFIFQWRTSLVALAMLPLMIIAGIIQMEFSQGFNSEADETNKQSCKFISQSLIHIRTVASFSYESVLVEKYKKNIEQAQNLALRKGKIAGLFFGLSQLILFITFGALFYIGAIFMSKFPDQISTSNIFTAIYALMIAGMTAGNNAHFMPDTAACKNSSKKLFKILDSEDEDQMQVRQQSKMMKLNQLLKIQFKNACFKYQNRRSKVFDNLNLIIEKGKKTAFVGSSGCGKSTILLLLKRFYELSSGDLYINGEKIKDYSLHNLRSNFVSIEQQPVLFNSSFSENIKYNLKESQVSNQQIIEAAKKSYSYDFISIAENNGSQEQQSLHNINKKDQSNSFEGFNRSVGVRGSHISGGQKQRVAIARVIIRKPKILLLDEATSALDPENERKVQISLNEMMKDKTVISVAHRINTIKDFDIIIMFQEGKVVESGTYIQLMRMKRKFFQMVSTNA